VAPIVALGGELKSTFCLTRDDHAFLSQHIGDMQNLETMQAFEHALAHLQAIFGVEPTRLACDQHPGYLSTRWAEEHAQGRPLIRVQHHHAHIAAVMAEHRLDGQTPVIGFSFDGTGYGDDGAIWGGEVLVADYRGYRRAAHLKYTPLPGGDAAVKRPYRLALAQLWAAGVAWAEALPPVAACPPVERKVLAQQLTTGFQCVPTSSMGRLFDAVAALLGMRQTITYEGQAAIELEALAQGSGPLTYHFDVTGEAPLTCDPAPLIRAVAQDVQAGQPVAAIASAFHAAVAELIVTLALRIRQRTGLQQVALSGGVFQNVRLLEMAMRQLQAQGFTVLVHRLVPPNDGGLALGQAVIANFSADTNAR
jgi:hydrogenase maturation protein HypF